jgi:IS1 family transposase
VPSFCLWFAYQTLNASMVKHIFESKGAKYERNVNKMKIEKKVQLVQTNEINVYI